MAEILYLCGATASGKSSLAMRVANYFHGEIVNADVYQSYSHLEVVTAAPTAAETKVIPHHLYNVISPVETMDAARFCTLAQPVIQEIRSRGKLPIVVGGSGLYLKFLTHGISPAPPGDAKLRLELEKLELEELAERLERLDPEEASRQNLKNRRHVTRALEICLLTDGKASDLRKNWEDPELENNLRGILLQWSPDDLDPRIRERTSWMLDHGAIEEVADLSPKATTASKAIGVPEIRQLLDGALTREQCEEQIFYATRRYAKRQRNWFRKESWLTQVAARVASSDDYDGQLVSLIESLGFAR